MTILLSGNNECVKVKNLSDLSKKILFILGALLLLLILASIAYYRSLAFLPFAAGALLGVALNALKVIMLDRAVKKAIAMEKKSAGNYIGVQNIVRLLLTGLVLVLSAVLPFLNLWGAAAGVFTLQIALFLMKRSLRLEESNKNHMDTPATGGD